MGCLGFEPRTFRLKAEYSTIELATLYHLILAYFIKISSHKILFTFSILWYILILVLLTYNLLIILIKTLKEIRMSNIHVIGQLLSTAFILLSGPVVILLLALKKGNL